MHDPAAPDPPGVPAGVKKYLDELQAGLQNCRADHVLVDTSAPMGRGC